MTSSSTRSAVASADDVHDPAVMAIRQFHNVQRGFERWLDQDQDCFLDQKEVDRQEADWQADYVAKLDVAVRAVPNTMQGVRALSAVLAHQQDMGAPTNLIELASRSIQRGLAALPNSEWRSA